ncbi:MAG TPA: glycosyltransferase family 4 protein [Pyrinomonadaceae bacterium]|nr:glycosyltransferase family 4 protein [Pyrinomonadaceae bacterium]
MKQWVCCQLGAREHYAVPRALHLNGLLSEFITDLWIRPNRFHPALTGARVTAPNLSALTFELKAGATRANGWKLICERNEWFQRRAVDQLAQTRNNGGYTVFAYSYAAERIFKFARERGWRTVLGQIDPGPAEERIVAELHKESNGHWKPAPTEYWDRWRLECELADQIVVNSTWSQQALLSEGLPAEKIRVLPLAYETSASSKAFERYYPDVFTAERPLRVLFLGQINLRKGAGRLFDAIRLLSGENIEFWFVGPTQICVPADLKNHPRIKWFGAVPRLKVDDHYRNADVFVLPTLSDGFGLTQLEAQSWKLPVVASRRCGEVVDDGVNGSILKEVSGQTIAAMLLNFLRSPDLLHAMSARSGVGERFSLEILAASLSNLSFQK